MIVHQVELVDDQAHHAVVWVDAALALRPGNRVHGRDGHVWGVSIVYRQQLDVADINRDWRVGGAPVTRRVQRRDDHA